MPSLITATPQISVRLYKTITRKTIDGQTAVSARYEGTRNASGLNGEFIDLTPFLNLGSSVRTSKSVREPAGAFVITFADMPNMNGFSLESVYGLVEPMDVIEIRMWGGTGVRVGKDLPIIMRGFVSDVQRQQAMSDDGRPTRQVVVSGQDYGKIWQTFMIIYLAAYAEGKPLLTNFALWELFGIKAENTLSAAEFIRKMVQKIINPHIAGFMPENSEMPREIKTGDSISVKHGVVSNSYQQTQGSVYDAMKYHGDVGIWNELYTEDREDGVHCVYRPVPAMHLTAPENGDRMIQDDAPEPIFVDIPDGDIVSISVGRSDNAVYNFYWVLSPRFDLIDDLQRKLASIPANDPRVSTRDYPNTAVKYYGVRAMYAETQQGEDTIKNMGPGEEKDSHEKRSEKQESWIDKRRRLMIEMNKDNVVLERGSARIKGGPMRPDGESMKSGDYAYFITGQIAWPAYVVQIDHEFMPFQSYMTTLIFERGEGFVERSTMEGGINSPWLAEQATF